MRDFLPEEKIFRDQVMKKIKEVFETYGFLPLETPALELYEVLASKYAGGAEILKETYAFEDKAGRMLALRYDHTVPLARVIAMHAELPMPFKRYAIDKVWRYFEVKKGRYREFYQCDVDIVGSGSMQADAECLACAADALEAVGFEDFFIRLSNRKLLFAFLERARVRRKIEACRIIDKLDKIGKEGVKKELSKMLSAKQVEKVMESIELRGGKELLDRAEKLVKGIEEGEEGVRELRKLIDYLDAYGKAEKVRIDLSLARGLDYYTGPIFEIWSSDVKIGSLAGGGRYDEMIGKFAGRGKIPATGISIGIERVIELLKEKEGMKEEYLIQVYIAVPSEDMRREAIKIAGELRRKGIRADMDVSGKSLKRQLSYCDKLGIRWIVIVGREELEKGEVKVRDMKSGKEERIPKADLIDYLTKLRRG